LLCDITDNNGCHWLLGCGTFGTKLMLELEFFAVKLTFQPSISTGYVMFGTKKKKKKVELGHDM
jgi:hypothetical protein